MRAYTWLMLVFLMLTQVLAGGKTGQLIVSVNKFDNDSGLVLVGLFNKPDGFPANVDKAFKKSLSKIKNKQAKIVFDSIPFGRYAVCAMRDLDGDGVMKLDKQGLPIEGYGVSNNIKARFGPPLFSDALFYVVISKKEILINIIE